MKKINPRKGGFFIAKVLRSLRMNRGFCEPISGEKGVHAPFPASNYHDHQKEIETALMEAERKKAEALMRTRVRFIC